MELQGVQHFYTVKGEGEILHEYISSTDVDGKYIFVVGEFSEETIKLLVVLFIVWYGL